METSQFDFNKYLVLLRNNKGLFVVISLTVMTVAVLASYLLPVKYEAKCTVFIQKSIINDLVKGIAVTHNIEDKTKLLTYDITSKTIITKVIDELKLDQNNHDNNHAVLINKFKSNISVRVNDKGDLFTVSLIDNNPRIARDVVNTLVRIYTEGIPSAKKDDAYDASTFLTEQSGTLKKKLENAESEISSFKRQKGALVNMDPAFVQKEIYDSQQRLDDIAIKRAQAESLLSNVKKNRPQNSRLSALQKKLEELEGQYTDKYPEIIKTREEIETIKNRASSGSISDAGDPVEIDKVSAEVRALKQAESNLRNNIARNQQILASIPNIRAELDRLEREKSSNKNLYDQLSTRLGQSEFSQQKELQDKLANFRIVAPATAPDKPISPDRVKIILMGIAGGLFAGFGLLILKDNFDPSVKTVTALKDLGYPVLAIIPSMHDEAMIIAQRKSDFRIYVMASAYFSLILMVLLFEVTGIKLVSKLFGI